MEMLLYYLSAEIFALSVTYNEPWFTNTKYFYTGPGNYSWPDLKYKMKLKALYMYTGGFYIYSIFALIFWETRRSDFGVLMGHHVVTSFLIMLSYTSSFELTEYINHKVDGPIYYYIFNTLLYFLLVLHIYWSVLVYRMLVNVIKARDKDVRSDSEDEDEHED